MEDLKAGNVFEKVVQTANIWVKDLMYEVRLTDPDRAYHVLRTVLMALRDRLPPEEASHLGAQLPLIIRGAYYDGWKMADKPLIIRDIESFYDHVRKIHGTTMDVEMEDAVRAVFKVLHHHLSSGEADKTRQLLPMELQELWPQEQRT